MRGGAVTRLLLIVSALLLLVLYGLFNALQVRSAALENAQQDFQQATTRANSLSETLRLQRERAADAQAIDTKHTRELTDAKADNDRQRAAVAAGQQRLRVNATCRAGVPDTAGARGVADAGTPELTPQARQDYHALRDELAVSRQMILGLQEYVGTLCLR